MKKIKVYEVKIEKKRNKYLTLLLYSCFWLLSVFIGLSSMLSEAAFRYFLTALPLWLYACYLIEKEKNEKK